MGNQEPFCLRGTGLTFVRMELPPFVLLSAVMFTHFVVAKYHGR